MTVGLAMYHKQSIREGVKPTGGSVCNTTEVVVTVQKGEDQGGGKDLTDSLIIQHKQRIGKGVKPTGGSGHNPTEYVSTVHKGEE
jgi:hypothetical protein